MHVLGVPEILDDLSMLVKRVTVHGHRETNTKGGGGLKERFARGRTNIGTNLKLCPVKIASYKCVAFKMRRIDTRAQEYVLGSIT